MSCRGATSEYRYGVSPGGLHLTTCEDASWLMLNNFEFTRRLAAWAVVGDRRFVYASSEATYGDGSVGKEDGDGDLFRYRFSRVCRFAISLSGSPQV